MGNASMTRHIGATGPQFDPDAWRRRLAVAQRQQPADLVITGGEVVNVFTGELISADIAIADGVIAGVGEYREGIETHDATGCIIAPSFIDAHVHIESTHVWPTEFARAVVPHGTGAVVTDPHEIANVGGLAGIYALRAASANLPLHVRWTTPSCVPASSVESPGALLSADDLAEPLAWPESGALGELMNFPGVLAADPEVGSKLGSSAGMVRDGHAPGVRGEALQAYAGSGITSDHESTSAEEAREKLRAGLMIMIREGSSEHNLHELLPIVNERTASRCASAPTTATATICSTGATSTTFSALAHRRRTRPAPRDPDGDLEPARHWRLPGIGAVAPGYEANLVLLDSLDPLTVTTTLFQGTVVADQGQCTINLPPGEIPHELCTR